LATAELFVKEGAYVFITGRRQQQLDEAVKANPAQRFWRSGDVAKLADLIVSTRPSLTQKRNRYCLRHAGVGEFVPLGTSLKSISTNYSTSM